jgi:hypothetical protein
MHLTELSRLGALLAALLGSSLAPAALPSTATSDEVAHLLAYLERSGCQFSRNGKWYDAARAKDHLNRKYHYLLRKGLVRETEDFVRLAATKSSVSGKPYQVRCEGERAVPSETWLAEELARYRRQKASLI